MESGKVKDLSKTLKTAKAKSPTTKSNYYETLHKTFRPKAHTGLRKAATVHKSMISLHSEEAAPSIRNKNPKD